MSAAPFSPRAARRNFVTARDVIQVSRSIGGMRVKLSLTDVGRAPAAAVSILEQLVHLVAPLAGMPAAPGESDGADEKSCVTAGVHESKPEAIGAPGAAVELFLSECCERLYTACVPGHELTSAYFNWCAERGQSPLSRQAFTAALCAAGCRRNRSRRFGGKQTRTIEGVRLKVSSAPQLSLVAQTEETCLA